MPHDDRMRVSSIQRDDIAPDLLECPDRETYESELARVVSQAREDIEREGRGLAAVIANDRTAARRIVSLLGDEAIALIDDNATLPASGIMIMTLEFAKGLEFDHVIIPDAREEVFGDNRIDRNRLYTSISRATNRITLLAPGSITPLLKK